MRGHYRIDARLDGGAERHKLNTVQTVSVRADCGQSYVGIGRRVTVTGKVLGRCERPTGLNALYHRCDKRTDLLRIFPETPNVDDRIVRVVVDVSDWRI